MGTTQAAAGGEAGGLGWAQTPGCSEIWGAPPGDMRAYIHTYIRTYIWQRAPVVFTTGRENSDSPENFGTRREDFSRRVPFSGGFSRRGENS